MRLWILIFLTGCAPFVMSDDTRERLKLQKRVERIDVVLREQDAQLRIMMGALEYESKARLDHTEFWLKYLEDRMRTLEGH